MKTVSLFPYIRVAVLSLALTAVLGLSLRVAASTPRDAAVTFSPHILIAHGGQETHGGGSGGDGKGGGGGGHRHC